MEATAPLQVGQLAWDHMRSG